MTADQLDALASLRIKNYEMSEAKALHVTPEVATLGYRLSWTDLGGEKPAERTVYSTVVFKHANGKWGPVFYQETPIAK